MFYFYLQGCIFPKIQPTTICRMERTSDKNQAKTQWVWSDNKIKAIFELSTLGNPYLNSLFGLIYEF